jgi:hypothetical protein
MRAVIFGAARLERVGIGIASSTFEIVGVPTLHLARDASGKPNA